jgi:hypothetical protein
MVSYTVMRSNVFFFFFLVFNFYYILRIMVLIPEDLEIQMHFPVETLHYQKQVYNISLFKYSVVFIIWKGYFSLQAV